MTDPSDIDNKLADYFVPNIKELTMFDDNTGAHKLDPDHQGVPPRVPEKGLLAGVLWRSFHDLATHVCPADRRAALAWFNAKPSKKKVEGFTFSDIVYYLNLGAREIKVIQAKVAEASQIENQRQIAIRKKA